MSIDYSLQNKPPLGAKIDRGHALSFGIEEAFLLNTGFGLAGVNARLLYSPFNTHLQNEQNMVVYTDGVFRTTTINSYIKRVNTSVPILDGYDQCTIVTRIKTFNRSLTPFQFFFSTGMGNFQIMTYINYQNNNIKTFFNTSTGRVHIGDANIITIENDEWVDIVIRYDGALLELFTNGQLGESVAKTGNMYQSDGLLYAGSRYGNVDGLNGEMEFCYIYHRALQDDEILSLQQNPYQIVEPCYLPPPRAEDLPILSSVSSGISFESSAVAIPTSSIITDHVDRAIALLIEQFKDKNALKNIIISMLSPIQELEYLCQSFLLCRNIDCAVGDQLDIVGEIAGEDRQFRLDPKYREAIKIRVLLNKSYGEPEIIILAVKQITKALECHYSELHPAGLEVLFKTNSPLPENLRVQIESIMLAGVKLSLIMSDDEMDFGFDGEGSFPPEPGILGFGETGAGYENEGGQYVEQL